MNLTYWLTLISITIVAGLGAYSLWPRSSPFSYQRASQPSLTLSQPSSQPMPIHAVQQGPAPEQTIGGSWTLTKSSTCHVLFPVPPKEAPYYYEDDPLKDVHGKFWDLSRKFWQLEEYDYGMVFATQRTSRLVFKEPNSGGVGYVDGLIEVNCSSNLEGLTTQQWIAKQESYYQENPKLGIRVKSRRFEDKWSREVAIVTLKGAAFGDEEYYLFATKRFGYVITRHAESTVKTIRDTTEAIFNSLQFLD